MTRPDLESRLAQLEAKEELRGFIATYCSACDAMSADAVAELFTADAVLRNAAGDRAGRDAIRQYYAAFFAAGVTFSRHHAVNQVFTILAPTLARHDAYFIAMTGSGGESRVTFGRYQDTLVKQDGRWLFRDKRNDVTGATTLKVGWADGFVGPPA